MIPDPISSYFDIADSGIPDWLKPIAERVRKLVDRPDGMARFRERVLKWAADRSAELSVREDWEKERQAYGRQLASLMEWADQPLPGWEIETIPLHNVGPAAQLATGWVPPHFLWRNGPFEYDEPLPLPERSLSTPEAFTIMAAIHDAAFKGVEKVHPWNAKTQEFDSPEDGQASVYGDLIESARQISDDDKHSVDELLRRVETDMGVLAEDKSSEPSQTHPESSREPPDALSKNGTPCSAVVESTADQAGRTVPRTAEEAIKIIKSPWATYDQIAPVYGLTPSALRGKVKRDRDKKDLMQRIIFEEDVRPLVDGGLRNPKMQFRVAAVHTLLQSKRSGIPAERSQEKLE